MSTRTPIAELMQKSAPALLKGDAQALLKLEIEASDLAFRGIQLLAPNRAPGGGALPVVLLMQKSALRGWQVDEQRNLALAAYDPHTGALQVGPVAAAPDASKTPLHNLRRPPRPPASAERTTMVNTYHVDARARLDLPRGPGPLVLHALAWDWVSNGARVELDGAAGRPAGPATIRPAAATEPGRLPAYETTPRHPPPPDAGLAFKIERLRQGGHTVLGSFAKLASAADLPTAPLLLATGSGPRLVVAVVRVALAMVSLDSTRPLLASWAIPVYGRSAVQEGERIAGYFEIDLAELGVEPLTASQRAYLFMDDQAVGPQAVPAPAR